MKTFPPETVGERDETWGGEDGDSSADDKAVGKECDRDVCGIVVGLWGHAVKGWGELCEIAGKECVCPKPWRGPV